MGTSVFIASIAGLVAGGWFAFAAMRLILGRVAHLRARPEIVRRFAWACCAAFLIPAAIVAFVAGGNFGGALGARRLAQIESLGVAIGIFAGVGLVFAVCLLAASLLGVLLGLACVKVLGARPAT